MENFLRVGDFIWRFFVIFAVVPGACFRGYLISTVLLCSYGKLVYSYIDSISAVYSYAVIRDLCWCMRRDTDVGKRKRGFYTFYTHFHDT